MSVMSAGKPVGLDGTVAPPRPRRGGISRRGPAGVPRVSVPRVGVSATAWSRAGVSRAGVWGAGVPGTGVSARVGVSQQRGIRLAVSRRAQRAASVRLTRRGRIVVGGLLTVAVLLAAILLWLAAAARAQSARAQAASAQAASAGSPPGAVYRNLTPVVVHPGESLWSIALRAQPSADPRIVVQQIIELNALNGTGIEPGEHLWVPRG